MKEDNVSSYEYDNTTSEECNDLMEYLESGTFTNIIWSIFKPYVRGRILYTPNTKATQKLMAVVNEAFAPVENLRKVTQDYADKYSKSVRKTLLNRDTQEFLKDILIKDGTDSIFDTFSNSPLGNIQWLAKKLVIWSIYLINLVFLTKVFEL